MRTWVVLAALGLGACSLADGHPPRAARADCALIAASLTSLEMGNYAEAAKRAPREAELAARCRDAELTDADARCLLDATSDTLAFCRQPLAVAHRDVPPPPRVDTDGLPPACRDYMSALQRLAGCPKLPAQSRSAILDAVKQAAPAWRQVGQNAQAVAALQNACQNAVGAIEQSARSVGCQ